MPEPTYEGPWLDPAHPIKGLLVDWGGVLTGPLAPTIERWATDHDVDLVAYFQVMDDWLGGKYAREARMNPVHALERGEIENPEFEEFLAHEMSLRSSRHFESVGFLQKMFNYFEHSHDMNSLVHRAHRAGIRTALLSNSWGNEYPREGWNDMFDAVVISGEVGMRKPEERIYLHSAELLGLKPHECVFIDDMTVNVEAAVALGIIGIHHTSYEKTAAELEAIFNISLA